MPSLSFVSTKMASPFLAPFSHPNTLDPLQYSHLSLSSTRPTSHLQSKSPRKLMVSTGFSPVFNRCFWQFQQPLLSIKVLRLNVLNRRDTLRVKQFGTILYYMTHVSAKSDVFDFGVVLIEIVSGREPLNVHRPRPEWSLVEWAKSYVRESRIDEIVDPSIKGAYHAEAMWRVVEVAVSCIEPSPASRPNMVEIVRELEDALIIENNASVYMRSIESSGSNRFSVVME